MLYSTTAKASAGREGTAELVDGSFAIAMVPAGSKRDGQNPEQLFALGYAACFDNAAKIVAGRLKLPLEASETQVTVSLSKDGDAYRIGAKVVLATTGLTDEQANQLAEESHKVCPYSNALRGNADVELTSIAS